MKQTQDPWTMHRPRTYNWSKRSPRTGEDQDPDYVTVFDVATGQVIKGDQQEGESPRKRIKSKDEATGTQRERELEASAQLIIVTTETLDTSFGDDNKQQLEDQVRDLKKALAEMYVATTHCTT